MDPYTLVSLAIYFVVMLAIGGYSYKQSSQDIEGYMLGGRGLSPKVTALSAGASDMSGWMLMGLPGAMYVSGFSSAWIAIGLLIGAYFNYLLVAPRLRVYTEKANNALTIPDYFEHRFNDKSRSLRIISALVILFFFTLYTSSGIVAGGKLFESAFGYHYQVGIYVTTGVVVAYTLLGGFTAVSMTDFVQGCIMFLSLVLVPLVVLFDLGGFTQVTMQLSNMPYDFLDLFSNATTGQAVSLIGTVSLLSWGLGYFGQPHIIVRFMAIHSVKDIKIARRIGMSWMLVSITGALATGLFGLAYVSKYSASISDPETIFIFLSQLLFHPLISGFLLGAILAAIMSTISSQLLVTSSSLTGDIYQIFLRKSASQKELVVAGRVSVLIVALFALYLAHDQNSSILSLVSSAWAGFGAAFGPVILLSLYWPRMTRKGAICGMLVGAITVIVWSYGSFTINEQALSAWLYEIVPGFIACTLTIIAISLVDKQPAKQLTDTYQQVVESLQSELTSK